MSTYTNWLSACRFLSRKIERFKPLAGSNITIEQTASGRRISLGHGGSGGGGGYAGYFKVVDCSAVDEGFVPAVAVVDGRLTAEARLELPAGTAVINDTLVECGSGQLAPGIGISYVSAEFMLSDEQPMFLGYRASGFLPQPEEESLSILLATVETGESSLRIYQQQHGMIYNYIFRSC